MSPRAVNVAMKIESPKRSQMFFNPSTTRKKALEGSCLRKNSINSNGVVG